MQYNLNTVKYAENKSSALITKTIKEKKKGTNIIERKETNLDASTAD